MPDRPSDELVALLQFSEQMTEHLLDSPHRFVEMETTAGEGLAAFVEAQASSGTAERVRKEAPIAFAFAALETASEVLRDEYLALADQETTRLYHKLEQARAEFDILTPTEYFQLAGTWLVVSAGLEETMKKAFQHPASYFFMCVLMDYDTRWVSAGDASPSGKVTAGEEGPPEQEHDASPGCLALSAGLLASGLLGSLLAVGVMHFVGMFGINLWDCGMLLHWCSIGTVFTVYLDRETPWRKRLGQGMFYFTLIVVLMASYDYRPDWVRRWEEIIKVLPPFI